MITGGVFSGEHRGEYSGLVYALMMGGRRVVWQMERRGGRVQVRLYIMNRYILLLAFFLQAPVFAVEVSPALQMQRAVVGWPEFDTIKALVRAGVDPNAPIGCGGFTPLDRAISRQNPEMMDLLLSLGARPKEGQMVDAAFCSSGDAALRMVKALQAAGLSVNARDKSSSDKGRSSMAIHSAVYCGHTQLVAYLLKQKGALLNEVNVDGYTPLMIAVERGRGDMVDLLLAAGADPRQKNEDGLSALDVADKVIAAQVRLKAKLEAPVRLAAP